MATTHPGYRIRKTSPRDAAALHKYLKIVHSELNPFLILERGEFKTKLKDTRKLLKSIAKSQNSLMLAAHSGNDIIASLHLAGGTLNADRHAAWISISVRKDWRRRGIGKKLFDLMLRWAKSRKTLRRLQLWACADNRHAIHLYRNCGFTREALFRKAFRRGPKYIDALFMVRFI